MTHHTKARGLTDRIGVKVGVLRASQQLIHRLNGTFDMSVALREVRAAGGM